jgi:hypothetical protein
VSKQQSIGRTGSDRFCFLTVEAAGAAGSRACVVTVSSRRRQ